MRSAWPSSIRTAGASPLSAAVRRGWPASTTGSSTTRASTVAPSRTAATPLPTHATRRCCPICTRSMATPWSSAFAACSPSPCGMRSAPLAAPGPGPARHQAPLRRAHGRLPRGGVGGEGDLRDGSRRTGHRSRRPRRCFLAVLRVPAPHHVPGSRRASPGAHPCGGGRPRGERRGVAGVRRFCRPARRSSAIREIVPPSCATPCATPSARTWCRMARWGPASPGASTPRPSRPLRARSRVEPRRPFRSASTTLVSTSRRTRVWSCVTSAPAPMTSTPTITPPLCCPTSSGTWSRRR